VAQLRFWLGGSWAALALCLVRLPVRLLALAAAVVSLVARRAEPAPDRKLALGARRLLQLLGLHPKAHERVHWPCHPMHQIAGLGFQRPSDGEGIATSRLPELAWVLAVVLHRLLCREIDKAPVIAANNRLPGSGSRRATVVAQRWLKSFVVFDALA